MKQLLMVEKFSTDDYWYLAQKLSDFVNVNKILKDQILKIISVVRDNTIVLFYYK